MHYNFHDKFTQDDVFHLVRAYVGVIILHTFMFYRFAKFYAVGGSL